MLRLYKVDRHVIMLYIKVERVSQDMFDNLWEQDPKIKKLQSEKKAEGIIEGEILGLQEAVVEFVEARFPVLAELAQQRVSQISNLDDLNRLVKLIATTADEATANWILSRLAA